MWPMDGRKPRLLACDLDGTLLDETGALRPAVIAAIESVRAAGIHVVLATGRNPWAVADTAHALGLPGPQIVMNGGAFVSPVTSEVAWARRLEPELVLEAIAVARGLETAPLLGFLDSHARERAAETAARPDFATGPRFRHVDTIEALAGDGPIRVYLPTPPEMHARALAEARDRFGGRASIVYSDELGFEVMEPRTNKGEALRRVAAALGVDRSEVAAIGDGPNDREMLAFAGRSAALLPNSGAGYVGGSILSDGTQVVAPSARDGAVEAMRLFFPDLDLGPTPRGLGRLGHPAAASLGAVTRFGRDDDPEPDLSRTAA
jgi:Cof subfamily protein (haloacid dehalogenase superfamily)